MPRNGSGSFTILTPIEIGALRSSSVINADYADVGAELTNSLPLDGTAAMTGQFRANDGEIAEPGISFEVDPNTGFRLRGADEMAWVSGAQDRAIMGADGTLTFSNGLSVAGSAAISSTLSPQSLSNSGSQVATLQREENDTVERELVSYESGSGSGAKGSLRVVGGGANDAATMRYYVNNVKAFEWTSALFTIAIDAQIGAPGTGVILDASGFIDLAELTAAPTAPASNVARIYSRDDGAGGTQIYWKDSAGVEATVRHVVDRQTFTASGTWTKPTTGQAFGLIECWGAGASGAKYSAGTGGGGGGGGGYSCRTIALTSISASVSVTIGAGGAAQTIPNTGGSAGGNSSFGSYVSANGGAGASSDFGGVGGGLSSGGLDQANPRGLFSVTDSTFWGGPEGGSGFEDSNPFGGAMSGSSAPGGSGLWGGGGGGRGGSIGGVDGGDSVYGGGGGGGGTSAGSAAAGGVSIFGGAGGAGATGAPAAVAGTTPSGGGGGSEDGASGAGARGEIRITCW